MYQLRRRNFTYAESGLDPADMKAGKRPFGGLITDSPEFEFDMEDIARIREEIRRLIERLSHCYTFWKKTKEKAEKEARLEEKALNEANKSDAKISNDPPESVAANEQKEILKKSVVEDVEERKEESCVKNSVVQDVEERKISSSDDFSLRTGGAENSENITTLSASASNALEETNRTERVWHDIFNLASNVADEMVAVDKLDEDEQQDCDGSPAAEFGVAHI
jgi:sugar-specific transcriptional regulator TrmB